MRIKIRQKNGTRIWARAIATESPYLFITPARERDIMPNLRPAKRGRFLKDTWTITHKPSGYGVCHMADIEGIKKLAALFSKSKIPWARLRSKKDAAAWAKEYNRVMRLWNREAVTK